jgi:hypothetical protein
MSEENLAIARRYIAALSTVAGADEVGQFYVPDVVQEEFPNRLLANGATRDVDALKQARARGTALLSAGAFELIGVSCGPQATL